MDYSLLEKGAGNYVFLMHKNPQQCKIICGMHPVGRKDQLIDL